jgi:hypothetical protein
MTLLQHSFGRIEKCYCDDNAHDVMNCDGDNGIGIEDGGNSDSENGRKNKIITSFHYHYHASIVIMTNIKPSIHNYHLLQQRLLSFDNNSSSSDSDSGDGSYSSNYTSRLVLHMIRNYSYININDHQNSSSISSSLSTSPSSTLHHQHHYDIPQLKEELLSSSSSKPYFRFVGYDSNVSIYSSMRIQEVNINDR